MCNNPPGRTFRCGGPDHRRPAPTITHSQADPALLVIGGCCHDYKQAEGHPHRGHLARANVQWTIAYDPDKGTKHLNPVYEKADWAKGFDVSSTTSARPT